MIQKAVNKWNGGTERDDGTAQLPP